MQRNFVLLLLGVSLVLQKTSCLEEEIDKNGDVRVENGEELNTQNLSSTIIIVLLIMAINNYLVGEMKIFRQKFKTAGKCIQDSAVSTSQGIVIGLIMRLIPGSSFNKTIQGGFENLFMLLLLPPILFESALNMQKRPFFKNIGSIVLFAILGTMISVVIIATLMWVAGSIQIAKVYTFYECLIFGSLISATDPVSVLATFKEINAHLKLYSLIFGESILNDAISITLYRSLINIKEKTHFSTTVALIEFFSLQTLSCVIGIALGLGASYLLKKVDLNNKKHISQELSICMIVPWVSYLAAESFELSGIVSIMFCGIAMAQYSLPNMSSQAKSNIKQVLHTVAENFEALAFILIGAFLSGFSHDLAGIGIGILVLGFVFLLFARYCNIYGVSFIINQLARDTKINGTFQFVLWFSGFRGAMAFAIALQAANKFQENDVGRDFLTLTVIYTCITIFLFGGALQMVIEKFNVSASTMDRYDFDSKNCCDFMKIKFMEFNERYLEKNIARAEVVAKVDDINEPKYMDSPDVSRVEEDRVKKLKLELEGIKICREEITTPPPIGSVEKKHRKYSKRMSQLTGTFDLSHGKFFKSEQKKGPGSQSYPEVDPGSGDFVAPENESGQFFNKNFDSAGYKVSEQLETSGISEPEMQEDKSVSDSSKGDSDIPQVNLQIPGEKFDGSSGEDKNFD